MIHCTRDSALFVTNLPLILTVHHHYKIRSFFYYKTHIPKISLSPTTISGAHAAHSRMCASKDNYLGDRSVWDHERPILRPLTGSRISLVYIMCILGALHEAAISRSR